jgi:hypothetical protein
MAILPVVGLEQVIVQSPAMLPERLIEQRREDGASVDQNLGRVGREEPTPLGEIGPVPPVDEKESPDRGLEKEIDSEYAPNKGRGKIGGKKRVSGKVVGKSDGMGRLLDIEA